MTEKQHRQFKRDCELDDRARTIIDKEKRKKENKLKRLKKEEKEREQRRKAGLPEKPEGYVSPRQCRLGTFFGQPGQAQGSRGNTTERDDEDGDQDGDRHTTPEMGHPGREVPKMGEPEIEDSELEDSEMKEPEMKEPEREQPCLPTSTPKHHVPEGKILQEHSLSRPSQGPHKVERLSQIDWSTLLPEGIDWLEDSDMDDFLTEEPELGNFDPLSSTSKDEVPEGKVWQDPSHNEPSQASHKVEKLSQIDQSEVLPREEIDWLALLPSDTQIEKELSCSPSRSKFPAKPVFATPAPSGNMAAVVSPVDVKVTMAASVSAADVEATLAFLSTQDLSFTSEEIEELTTPANSKVFVKELFHFGEFGVCTQEFLELED